MNKKMLGFVAVAAFLAVEFSAGTADAQGMLKRMRARFGRTQQTQCCPATCQTSNCQTAASPTMSGSVVAPVSYSEPISFGESVGEAIVSAGSYSEPVFQSGSVVESPIMEGPVMQSAPCGDCVGQAAFSGSIEPAPLQQIVDTGSFQAIPTVGCVSGDCGSIQQASYVEPIAEGEYFGGDSGCIGCETPVQGCASGDCGSVVSDGGIVQGQIFEGEVITGEISGGTVTEGSVIEGGIIEGGVIEGGVIEGGVIEGGVIEGGSVEGGIIDAPISESASDVPEPPTQAPVVDDDQDA